MSKYIIRDWSNKQAKKHNLSIFPAENGKHKLEVYDDKGLYLANVGALGYLDYAQYLDMEKADMIPKGTADERRRLYHLRHQKEKGYNTKNSRSWLAANLLW
jgi:hypothetical protein